MFEPLSKEFLLNRGYCCKSGCLNCPYKEEKYMNFGKWLISHCYFMSEKEKRSNFIASDLEKSWNACKNEVLKIINNNNQYCYVPRETIKEIEKL